MAGVFVQSAAILVREGLEALLVITALAAYLKPHHESAVRRVAFDSAESASRC